MVFTNIVSKVTPLARKFTTSAVCKSGEYSTRGVVGSNLPFQIENRYRLMVVFILYFGSGLAIPFLCLRHLILQKNRN